MKKNLGSVNALYPSLVVMIGTEVEGRANYTTVAYVGIVDLDIIAISLGKGHFANAGIKANKTLSINIPTETMVVETDYVGIVSGNNVDKSQVFENFHGELKGAPMIKEAPLNMECDVIEVIEMPTHELFLVRPRNTYVNEEFLKDELIDISKVKPLLFDMPSRKYWKLGGAVADCWKIGKSYSRK